METLAELPLTGIRSVCLRRNQAGAGIHVVSELVHPQCRTAII